MYGKIFDSMYDGTLADDWRALITFQQLIVLCDPDGVIDMTPTAISRRTGIPIEHIKAGLEILENPDPYSRTPDEEGRRIKLLDESRPWGWYLVNHTYYKNLKDQDEVRAENRERKRRQRERERGHRENPSENNDVTSRDIEGQPVTDSDCPRKSRHTNTDTDFRHYVTGTDVPASPVDKNPEGGDAENAGTDPPSRDSASLISPGELADGLREAATWDIWQRLPGVNPSERQARSHLGKLIRDYGEGAVRTAIIETHGQSPPVAHGPSYVERLLRENPLNGKRPEWAVIPRDDESLKAWAAQHGFSKPRQGETYPMWRTRLRAEVAERIEREGK